MNEEERRERIEEKARGILETEPQPRPEESREHFAGRLGGWSEAVAGLVNDPELAEEITSRRPDLFDLDAGEDD